MHLRREKRKNAKKDELSAVNGIKELASSREQRVKKQKEIRATALVRSYVLCWSEVWSCEIYRPKNAHLKFFNGSKVNSQKNATIG